MKKKIMVDYDRLGYLNRMSIDEPDKMTKKEKRELLELKSKEELEFQSYLNEIRLKKEASDKVVQECIKEHLYEEYIKENSNE